MSDFLRKWPCFMSDFLQMEAMPKMWERPASQKRPCGFREANPMFRPRKHTVSSKENIVLEKIPSFFLQIHKSSLPLHRFPMG